MERERVKMAPAGNQHREDRRVGWWMDGLAGDERNETGYGRTAVYSSSLFPSFPFSPIYFPYQLLSLSLSLSTTWGEREELNIKASTASTFTEREKERDNALFIFIFIFFFFPFHWRYARAQRDQTDAQTGNYHVAVDVLFIHGWQLKSAADGL
jgi:hypothetical protein